MTLRAALLLAVLFAACEGQAPLATVGRPALDASISPEATADAASEHPGSAPDGGAADAARAPIPLAPDMCAPFHLAYTDTVVANPNDCPNIDCHCSGYSGPVPLASGACVKSVDCVAACQGDDWLNCALLRCSSDRDCAAGRRCVTEPGWTQGLCQDTAVPSCSASTSCNQGERCVAISDGKGQCIDPKTNDGGPCNQDADCPAGRCAVQGTSFVGVCAAGAVYAACFSDRDCASGLHCRNAADGQAGSCSDGADNTPCERDADCQVGVCAESVCSSGKVGGTASATTGSPRAPAATRHRSASTTTTA